MSKENETSKSTTNNNSILRVSKQTHKRVKDYLKKTNNINPKIGFKVFPEDLINLLLDKVTDEDLKNLKIKSYRQTDIDEILYDIYLKKKLGKNREDFSAFTKSADYFPFTQEHQHVYTV